MAITYPGAAYRQLPGKSRTLLVPQVITVHTMVGTLGGVEGYFGQAGNPYSHFGTGGSGEVRQWQDLAYRAASDLYGNPYNISIENEDRGSLFPAWSGSDVPRFTDAQADALVLLLSWLCHRFDLPRAAIITSCPHERGIGWHRLGVDPYRNQACGRKWSNAYAKACPGNRRIDQLVNEIIPRVSSPASIPGGPVADALTRSSYIYIMSDLLGFTAEERAAFLKEGRDGVKIPTIESIVTKSVRAEIARLPKPEAPRVDTAALAAAVADRLGDVMTQITDADLTRIARAAADEQDRRLRARLE